MMLIVADGHHQYIHYLRVHKLSREDAKYVFREDVLYGWPDGTKVMFTGTYYKRPDITKIEDLATAHRLEKVYED